MDMRSGSSIDIMRLRILAIRYHTHNISKTSICVPSLIQSHTSEKYQGNKQIIAFANLFRVASSSDCLT